MEQNTARNPPLMLNKPLPNLPSYCDHCDEHISADKLPSQAEFLRHHILPSHACTRLPPDDTNCGICLEELAVESGPARHHKVVFVRSCKHYFHLGCLLKWHKSNRPERDTCPICRRLLFVADRLTPAQLQELRDDERDSLDLAPSAPSEDSYLTNGEYLAMDILASLMVLREFDCVDSFGGRFHWSEVCQSMHIDLLTANGPLRPVFEPHRDTFILLIHSISLGIQISNHGGEMPSRDHHAFQAWVSDKMECLGEVLLRELLREMDRGIYVTPLHPLMAVPLDYQQQPQMNTTTVLRILSMFKEQSRVAARRALLHRLAAKLWPRRLVRRLSYGMSPRSFR